MSKLSIKHTIYAPHISYNDWIQYIHNENEKLRATLKPQMRVLKGPALLGPEPFPIN